MTLLSNNCFPCTVLCCATVQCCRVLLFQPPDSDADPAQPFSKTTPMHPISHFRPILPFPLAHSLASHHSQGYPRKPPRFLTFFLSLAVCCLRPKLIPLPPRDSFLHPTHTIAHHLLALVHSLSNTLTLFSNFHLHYTVIADRQKHLASPQFVQLQCNVPTVNPASAVPVFVRTSACSRLNIQSNHLYVYIKYSRQTKTDTRMAATVSTSRPRVNIFLPIHGDVNSSCASLPYTMSFARLAAHNADV